MTRYDVFKFLHLLGAIAWVGGGFGLFVTTRQLQSAGEHDGFLALLRQSQAIANRLFMPASLVTIVFGVSLVATEDRWSFGDLWILAGFGGVVLSGVVIMGLSAPAEKELPDLLAEHRIDAPEVAAVLRRVHAASIVDLGILTAVIWAMVAKPTL